MLYDVIIVGGGPCGITAATYLKRFGRNILLLKKDDGILNNSKIEIENYYGVDKTNAKYFVDISNKKLHDLDILVKEESVVNIIYDDHLIVQTLNNKYETKNVVLALGLSRKKPLIKNMEKYIGLGASYCASCDGFFYKDKKIGLIGNDEYLLHEYNILKNITNEITIFTNGKTLAVKGINSKVVTDKIEYVEGNEYINKIVTINESYDIDGLFIADSIPNADILSQKIGLLVENNEIVINELYMTNVPNIYAGGDCIKGIKQITKASYDGMVIAYNINNELNKNI